MEKLNELAAFLERNPGLADCLVKITYSEMYDIAEALRSLEQRAEAAEAKLAELAKQEAIFQVEVSGNHWLNAGPVDDSDFTGLPDGVNLLYAHPAPAADLAELVPDGWKLVPGEPTKEMVAAGQDRFEECIDSGFDSCEDGSTYEYSKISSDAPYLVYIAMLAAAPEVE